MYAAQEPGFYNETHEKQGPRVDEVAPGRPVSKLQTSVPSLERQARPKGALAFTCYGKTVAFLVSPEMHKRQEDLEQAANRALWAIDIQRGLHDLEAGRGGLRRALPLPRAMSSERTGGAHRVHPSR